MSKKQDNLKCGLFEAYAEINIDLLKSTKDATRELEGNPELKGFCAGSVRKVIMTLSHGSLNLDETSVEVSLACAMVADNLKTYMERTK